MFEALRNSGSNSDEGVCDDRHAVMGCQWLSDDRHAVTGCKGLSD